MEKGIIDLNRLPFPEHIRSEDIALLTENRQKIIVSLAYASKTLTQLSEEIKLQTSSTFESLDLLEKSHIVAKNDKIYSLTQKGKLLSFSLLKPNGYKETDIRNLLDKFLKEDMGITEVEHRKEIIENLRDSL